MMSEFIKSEVSFDVNGKHVSFIIIHNLPNVRGLYFNDALDTWLLRTSEYTNESLCKYIISKNTGHIAMTEEQFKKMKSMSQEERGKIIEVAKILRSIIKTDPNDWQFDVQIIHEVAKKAWIDAPVVEQVLIALSKINDQ